MKITQIRLRRMQTGLEPAETIKRLGISISTLYKIEQGRLSPSLKLLKRMADTYKCSADELIKDLNI